MREKQEIFDKYMASFVTLNQNQKIKELINKQKEVLMRNIEVASLLGIETTLLQSREINDILNENMATHQDYLEALMVYSQNSNEILKIILTNLESKTTM